MKKLFYFLVLISFFYTNLAIAQNIITSKHIPQAKLVGSYCFNVFGLKIYHIELWSKNGQFSYQQPLSLSITYHKNFTASQLTKKTISEIEKTNQLNSQQLAKYNVYINKLFVDVKKNQNKTAIFMPNGNLKIFLEQQQISEINDIEFAKDFLNIWLSPKSSYPKMSSALTNYISY
jgi:hypothetical protein